MKVDERIKKSIEFNNIIKKGKFLKNKYFVIYYDFKKEDNSRFGIAVGTKIGNAVTRNKIKRQMREIIKEIKIEFKNNQDYIIMVRKDCLNINYQQKKVNLLSLINKVDK
ncbi:MAG: ribonuclease P protein component [Bacilli bacterium]|nr:ribonuclease P protein component [Bacilli bacterium]MDD3895721.1 ribonuclease P protein component [Bacilli bacterium]MDD4407471.1 ribonuclease P protein component [Bacilli bacterium]